MSCTESGGTPVLLHEGLVWSSSTGNRYTLSRAAGGPLLWVEGSLSRPSEASAKILAALRSLPIGDGAFPAWAAKLGREACGAVCGNLLALWDDCAKVVGRERALREAGALLRLQALAGQAWGRQTTADLKQYLHELAQLSGEDRTLLTGRRLEDHLLQVIAPAKPMDLFRFEVEVLQQIDEWLRLRLAWGPLFLFRRWRRDAARVWASWIDRTETARSEAEEAGDVWDEEDRREEESFASIAIPRSLSLGETVRSGATLWSWQFSLTNPWGTGLLVAAPFAMVAAALAGGDHLALHPLLAGLWAFWLSCAVAVAHRFLSFSPALLWGSGAGGVLVAAAAVSRGTTALTSSQQIVAGAVLLLLTALVLITRLPTAWQLPDRLVRILPLLMLTTAFHVSIVLFLSSTLVSWVPAWADVLDASRVSIGAFVVRVPVWWAVGAALASAAAALGGFALGFKDPGLLTLRSN